MAFPSCDHEEIWRSVEDPEGFEFSSCGRIRDADENILNITFRDGEMVRIKGEGKRVARLIAAVFIPNPENFPLVKHKDDDNKNNHADNLYWTNRGKSTEGIAQQEIPVPVDQFSLDGKFLKSWSSQREIVKNVKGTTVDRIRMCYMGKAKTHAGFIWKRGDDSIEEEEWAEVTIKEKTIKVSNFGRVVRPNGAKYYGRRQPNGYMRYGIHLVHRLVAKAFCEGESEERNVVNHKDGDIYNNKAGNLAWASSSYNSRHSYFSPDNKVLEEDEIVEGEEWKDIEAIPNYKISDKGRIMGLEKRILTFFVSKGSKKVSIKGKHYSAKRLVAKAFIPNPESKKNVSCIDKDPENICVENLRWCSHNQESNGKRQAKKEVTKVVQIGLDDELIKVWDSLEDAVAGTKGASKTGVRYALWGKRKSHAGFIWKYENTLDLEGEIWKQISYKEKDYTVSSHGRIIVSHNKRTTGGVQTDGYVHYNGQKVHRLIATAFCPGQSEEKRFVNHIDGNKQNNHYTNLEWVTPARNLRHAHENGLVKLKPRN